MNLLFSINVGTSDMFKILSENFGAALVKSDMLLISNHAVNRECFAIKYGSNVPRCHTFLTAHHF